MVTDVRVFRLEREIRESCAFRAPRDPPDAETHDRLKRLLDEARHDIRADDAHRLAVLIDRLTGVK